ncbi:MAG: HDIG domain-containing metalloprotein [Acidobacteriota bacterium]
MRDTATRLAVRRGEFVQVRRQLLGKTWLWFAAFAVGAVVLVAPGRSTRYPVLEAGDVAPRDIVVRRELVLPDPDATERNRRQATLEVLPVYGWDPGVASEVTGRLERLIGAGQANPKGSARELAARLGEAAGALVEPQEAEALRAAGFSEELLATLREVIGRLYNQGVTADREELLLSADSGITLRVGSSRVERIERDVYRFIDGGAGLTETVEQRLGALSGVRRAWRAPLSALLARMLLPNVVVDRGETLARRLQAAAAVDEVQLRLPRGRVVVRRGDEITLQTARLLQALAAGAATTQSYLPVVGVFLLGALLAQAWYVFLKRHSPSPDEHKTRFGSIVILTLMIMLLERGFAFLAGGVAASVIRDPFGHIDVYLPALPHAAGPILAGLMFGIPVAVLFAIVQAILVSLFLGGDVTLTIYALLGGVAAAFVSQRMKDRNVLARSGVIVGAVNAVAVLGLALWHGRVGDLSVLAAQISAGVAGGILAAVLASFILPALESLTGQITDIRLLELANPNLPLLKRLSIEAPGTFQHSLSMANLAEAAAEAIGANPLLARVCCYYHDIGKLAKPEYFVENQRGENPHDHLTPWMSALVVSNHVKAGLELARQYKLPEPIREAITTHHGSKLIRYFYSRAKELEDADRGAVKESDFRYAGPRPHSKEMGILLLADAIEAAARTLKDPAPGRIQGMVDQIFKNALEDGQLDECDLTLKDIEKIGAAFFWVLSNAFHRRIDYPGFNFNERRRG